MRLRNRRALQDKTPVNSPRPAKTHSPTSKQSSVTKRVPPLSLTKSQLQTPTDHDDEEVIPGTPEPALIRDSEFLVDRELSLSPSAAASARKRRPMHSTPAAAPRRKQPAVAPSPTARRPAPPTPKPDRASSPLPPSSPPSDYEYTRKRISRIPPIPRVVEDDEERSPLKLQVYRDPDPVNEAPAAVRRAGSSDDPFGFLAVERKLKAQRAARKHPERAPAPALAFKALARESSVQPMGPLRSDDDDLYLDINPEPEAESNKENVPLAEFSDESLQKVEDGDREDGDGDEEVDENKDDRFDYVLSSDLHGPVPDEDPRHLPLAGAPELSSARRKRSSTEDDYDPLRTPHPAHVSREIYPIRSPFSSRSTPCDRDLAIDSAPSSPSPSKPLQVVTPLTRSSGPTKRLLELFKQSTEKAKGKRRAAAESEQSSSAKKARITTDEPAEDLTSMPASDSPLKRPVRRSARTSAPAAAPSRSAPLRAARAISAQHAPADESSEDGGGEVENEEKEDQKPTRKGKGKAVAKKDQVTKTTATARRGRKPGATSAKPPKKMSEKAKGKRKAKDVEDEDEEAAKARKARIEYFKKLDSDYSLAKEDVYVV
ncbi:hypothetical protein BXZ70DRAFT_743331 [Cristinia sonorae]|uniref:Uncharacterized protein n=1 Tax=Cristinia sonorae TaxID=1940300 RepID=A0A8K0UUV9_9AGAR|nr:hypothetical protein BXZ70DRAFT_743331 [Cristinia sonorae]